MNGHIDPTREQFAAFKELPREGRIHMLNLVRLRARALYPDGRDVSGRDAYRSYARESAAVFRRVGGRQHWFGRYELMVIGPSDERWDLGPVNTTLIAALPQILGQARREERGVL